MRQFWLRIKNYSLQLYSWFDKNLELLFVYSIPFVITGLIIETVRFIGFLRKFGLDTPTLMAVSLTMGLLWFKRENGRRNPLLQNLYNLLQFFCVAVVFFTLVVSILHVKTGASLIGSGSGQQFINLTTLFVIVMYIIALLVLPYVAKHFTLRGPVGTALFTIFIYIFILHFSAFSELYLLRAGRAMDLITLGENARIAKFWYTLFPLMDVINENTPRDAVILHPPQKYPWPETGNQFVIRRFLYPRTLIAPEFWDGRQEIDYILADNGGEGAKYHPENVGWPAEVFPVKKVTLAKPLKKQTIVTEFSYNNASFLPDLKEVKVEPGYEGKLEIDPADETVSISSSFTVPGHVYVMHSAALKVQQGSTLGLMYRNDHQVQVAPVVSFVDGAGKTQYLHYLPNLKSDPQQKQAWMGPEEKVEISDVVGRIQSFEINFGRQPKAEYEVYLGIDMGYLPPLPYLYGQSIVEIDKNPLPSSESCVGEECWLLIEHLVYSKEFASAQKVLHHIEPLYRGTPRHNFFVYKVIQGLGASKEEQVATLQATTKYWSDREYHNLPLFILKQMGVEKEKK